MQRLVLPLPGNEIFATRLASQCNSELGRVETRRFPDGESYVRLHGNPSGRPVDLVCTLSQPDPQFLSLIFAAETARDLGASEVNLIAPYLAYMRQDKRFHEGECVTSLSFAKLISGVFDSMVTIDPHLINDLITSSIQILIVAFLTSYFMKIRPFDSIKSQIFSILISIFVVCF